MMPANTVWKGSTQSTEVHFPKQTKKKPETLPETNKQILPSFPPASLAPQKNQPPKNSTTHHDVVL